MAALRRWKIIQPDTPPTSWAYKGHKPGRRERREQHMSRLLDLLNGAVCVPSAYIERCVDDDDDFDAFISALVARAVELELTDPIPRGDAWRAMREGWIHLPLAESSDLLASTSGSSRVRA